MKRGTSTPSIVKLGWFIAFVIYGEASDAPVWSATVVMLDSDDGMDAIANASEMSQRYGVDAVPFFIIDRKTALSGAQSTDVFVEAFRQTIGTS